MFCMKDILSLPEDLGTAIQAARKASRQKATDIARRSGRARSVLYRLERGEDVTVASLLDILRSMGLGLRLAPAAPPTLEDVRRRFGDDADEAGGTSAA
jgi:HTH-type transcriptional regulator / antitoxin HipB